MPPERPEPYRTSAATHQHHSRNTPALPNTRATLPLLPTHTRPRSHANAAPPKPKARTRPQKTAPFKPNTHTNTDALGSDTPPQTSSNTQPAMAVIARHALNHRNANHPSRITASPHHGTTTPPPPRLTASRHQNTTATLQHCNTAPPARPLFRRPEHLPSPIRCLLHLSAACCQCDQSDGGCNTYSKTICIKTFGKTIAYSPPNGHIARHQMYGFGRCILP